MMGAAFVKWYEKKTMNDKLQLFEDQPIRTAWDNESEEWYFSIVDVVRVLTESKDPNAYWRKLKQRLREEGNLAFPAFMWYSVDEGRIQL